jgi:hypothetical protein
MCVYTEVPQKRVVWGTPAHLGEVVQQVGRTERESDRGRASDAGLAGEMKHGPNALIDEDMPVVVIATRDLRYEKTLSNLKEVKARGGKVVAIAVQGGEDIAESADQVVFVSVLLWSTVGTRLLYNKATGTVGVLTL